MISIGHISCHYTAVTSLLKSLYKDINLIKEKQEKDEPCCIESYIIKIK